MFGFSNQYALAMRKELAQKLNIYRLSDLPAYPNLRLGLSPEFLKRADGWEELKKAYQLTQQDVKGLEHSLGYEALLNQQIDIIDAYTTDPKIDKYQLQLLIDDRHFFPAYEALLLYRLDVPQRFPGIWTKINSLPGSISEKKILQMNTEVELLGASVEAAVHHFGPIRQNAQPVADVTSPWLNRLRELNLCSLLKQHLFLVFASLLPAILVGIPLGILTTYVPVFRYVILHLLSMLQTIPAVALFAFLIPLLKQIGTLPSLIALFLYALLPIVRNTYAGLCAIPKSVQESAIVLGLPFWPRLVKIEIPLALSTILAGIKTAAVINVGMATIAAFIGAGGLGELIMTGLALNNSEMILAGAIPASFLAILVQLSFDLLEYVLVPKGLRGFNSFS